MVLHTTVLLRREHRRPPVLLPATTGHVHETIDDLAKTSRNTSLSLSPSPFGFLFLAEAHSVEPRVSLWKTVLIPSGLKTLKKSDAPEK